MALCGVRPSLRSLGLFNRVLSLEARALQARQPTKPKDRRVEGQTRGRTLQSLAQSKLCQRSLHLNTRKHTQCLHAELAPFQNLLPRICFCEGVTVHQGISRLCLLGQTVPSCHHHAMQIQEQPGFPGAQGTPDVYGRGLQFR